MAKRVLGDDPFAPQTEKPDDAAAAAAGATKKSVAPASAARESKKPTASRASKRPSGAASRASTAPAARTSRAPAARSGGAKVSAESDEARGTSASAAAPASAEHGHAAVAAAPAPSAHEHGALDAVSGSDAASSAAPEATSAVVVPLPPRAPRMASEPLPTLLDEVAEESTAAADLPPEIARASSAPYAEPATATATSEPAGVHAVEHQIRDLESQLDRLLAQVGERGADATTIDRVAERLRAKMDAHGRAGAPNGNGAAHGARDRGGAAGSDAPPAAVPAAASDESAVFDVARELLSSEYAARQWGRVALRDRAAEVDEFGLDPKYAARVRPFFDFLYARWWRVEAHDIDNVPAEGRVILCANHSGALPYDGAMLATALRREHPAHRELRWLAEDFVFHFPFLGVFMNRIGAVRACQENAERLLKTQRCVGVFPEGVKGIAKMFRDRYKLQRFGRGGHVKLAIRTRTPIVPVAIVGAEEAAPLIAPTQLLAKALGVPYVPITPTFPWLGPAGLLPLPSKWKIYFLEPISVEQYAPDQADDDVLVGRLNEKIRAMIQDQLDRAVRARRSVFRG